VHERDLLDECVDGDPVELGPLAEGEHAAAPRPTGRRAIAELVDHKPKNDADVHCTTHMLPDMSHTDTQLPSARVVTAAPPPRELLSTSDVEEPAPVVGERVRRAPR
jgi:hypothetical protein